MSAGTKTWFFFSSLGKDVTLAAKRKSSWKSYRKTQQTSRVERTETFTLQNVRFENSQRNSSPFCSKTSLTRQRSSLSWWSNGSDSQLRAFALWNRILEPRQRTCGITFVTQKNFRERNWKLSLYRFWSQELLLPICPRAQHKNSCARQESIRDTQDREREKSSRDTEVYLVLSGIASSVAPKKERNKSSSACRSTQAWWVGGRSKDTRGSSA